MSPRARIGVIVGLIVVLGGLFLVLRPSGDDEPTPGESVQTKVPVASPAGYRTDVSGDHTHTLTVKDGAVTGDRSIEVTQGTMLTLRVEADVDEEIHVHGYDLTATVTPDQPAELAFTADVTGTFEVEFEDSGLLLTEIEVTP